MHYVVFEYQYRDAGNFKAFGEIWLSGALTEQAHTKLVNCLESSEFFIAEQIGIPPLYHELFFYSGGRTTDDHSWHTFLGIRAERKLADQTTPWGTVSNFLTAFVAVGQNWKPEMSPNFAG